MKFLLDGMLGGLARWLRILGHDVKYDSNTADNELLQVADKENMILLTSDAELFHRARSKRLSSLLVTGDTEEERLALIARNLGIDLDIKMTSTKCPECGSSLSEASKTEVAEKVREKSLTLYNEFWKCTGCGKVYWLGSHWRQIHQTLEKAKKITGFNT